MIVNRNASRSVPTSGGNDSTTSTSSMISANILEAPKKILVKVDRDWLDGSPSKIESLVLLVIIREFIHSNTADGRTSTGTTLSSNTGWTTTSNTSSQKSR